MWMMLQFLRGRTCGLSGRQGQSRELECCLEMLLGQCTIVEHKSVLYHKLYRHSRLVELHRQRRSIFRRGSRARMSIQCQLKIVE